jgi:hypothetical protein
MMLLLGVSQADVVHKMYMFTPSATTVQCNADPCWMKKARI